jgi:hypothetical protein
MAMHLTPAYGRDYTSQGKVLESFLANKDFLISDASSRWDGRPINRPQLEQDGVSEVNVRYKKLTRVVVLKKTNEGWSIGS